MIISIIIFYFTSFLSSNIIFHKDTNLPAIVQDIAKDLEKNEDDKPFECRTGA